MPSEIVAVVVQIGVALAGVIGAYALVVRAQAKTKEAAAAVTQAESKLSEAAAQSQQLVNELLQSERQERQSLQERVDELQSLCSKLESSLNHERDLRVQDQRELKDARALILILQADLNKAHAKIDEQARKLHDAEKDARRIASLEEQVTLKNAEIERLLRMVKDYEVKIEQYEQRISALEAANRERTKSETSELPQVT